MSLRQVLTIYNVERQLSDDETALLNTLRKMTDAERGMFVDGLSDKPSQKKSSERVIEHCNICNYTRRAKHHSDQTQRDYHEFEAPQSSKKSAGGGGGTKSRHASSLGQQIQKRQRRTAADESDDDNRFDGKSAQNTRDEFLADMRCAKEGCGWLQADLIHQRDGGYAGYHPFVSTAQAVESSSNQATSGTGKGSAGDAHHAASSGD